MGTILQVNTSFPGGIPKRPILVGQIGPEGIEGDGHVHTHVHGGPSRAVLIIASEVIDELVAKGYPLFAGALGENLTTQGFDVRAVRIGDRIRVGGAVLEISSQRKPCHQIQVYGHDIGPQIYDKQVKAGDPSSPRWGLSGWYASVVSPGPVGPGDPIETLAVLA
jgi:MOSC domain-containing protein YiiM